MLKKISLIAVLLLVLASSIYTINRVNKIEKHLAALTQQAGAVDEAIATIEGVVISKYGFGGVRRYIGEELFRTEPSADAPYIKSPRYEDNEANKVWSRHRDGRPLVEVLRVVHDTSFNGDKWALIDNAGTIGYVRLRDLADAEPYREYENVELELKESLGGGYLGERIEKLIGTLDEDYSLVREGYELYRFEKLDVLVRDSKKVHFLRTNSPQVELGSGYKVSDLASEVLEFYESKYEYLEMDYHTRNHFGNIVFSISDNVVLAFSIDTKELMPESIITEIRLHTLKPFAYS